MNKMIAYNEVKGSRKSTQIFIDSANAIIANNGGCFQLIRCCDCPLFKCLCVSSCSELDMAHRVELLEEFLVVMDTPPVARFVVENPFATTTICASLSFVLYYLSWLHYGSHSGLRFMLIFSGLIILQILFCLIVFFIRKFKRVKPKEEIKEIELPIIKHEIIRL